MGAANTKVNPAKKALRDYTKWLLKSSAQDDPVKIKEIFDYYDEDKKGHLSEEQALRYLGDVIEIATVDISSAPGSPHKLASEDEKKDFKRNFMGAMLHEMDPKFTHKVDFANLLKPNPVEILKKSLALIAKGSGELQFVTRLRETRQGKMDESEDASKEEGDKRSPKVDLRDKRKKKKELTDSGVTHEVKKFAEMDRAFEQALEAELREERLAKAILGAESHTPMEIGQLREAQVQRVSELLNVEPGTAQTLLHSIQWNEDQLLHEFFENREVLLKRVGLTLSGDTLQTRQKLLKSDRLELSGATFECSVCLDDVTPDDFTSLPKCKHAFCNNCWRTNLELQIKDGNALDLKCMHSGCKDLVPNPIVMYHSLCLVPNPNFKPKSNWKLVSPEFGKKFTLFLGKSYVNSNTNLKPCPARDCENALTQFTSEGFIKVGECKCSFRFCWECSKEAHSPITCLMLKRWEDECSGDPETSKWLNSTGVDVQTLKWIRENTKECPKCQAGVQKNDGCYYIRCINCQAEWCWLCQDDWATHPDHFQCTKFNKGREALSDEVVYLDDDEAAKRKRLGPIAERIAAMIDQENAMAKLKSDEKVKARAQLADDMKEKKASVDVECLELAVSTMLKCREALRYSHIFGFFTIVIAGPDSNYAYLIITLQDGLQMLVEKINNAINRAAELVDPNLVRRLSTVALRAKENMLEALVSMYENLDLDAALEKKQAEDAAEKEKEAEKAEKKDKKKKKEPAPAPRPAPVLLNPLYDDGLI